MGQGIMRIAIIGFGHVGKAFVRLLLDKENYLKSEGIAAKIIYIIDIGGGIYRANGITYSDLLETAQPERHLSLSPHLWSDEVSFSTLLKKKDVDLIVEMTPTNKETGEPGLTHIRKSLAKGLHVVTSNKGPVLLAYKNLKELAQKHSVQLGIGCTCGGALPAINGGIMDMAGSTIVSIEGVLNGTTNFIINEMENNKLNYTKALAKAQELGIAETDPTLDVEGWDTATKLLILTNVLMNEDKRLDEMSVSGITTLTEEDIKKAQSEGNKFKLIGRSLKDNDTLTMTVKLEKISRNHLFYNVDGANKAVRYISDTLGDLTMIGGASDLTAAAASILRDIINIHRGYKFPFSK